MGDGWGDGLVGGWMDSGGWGGSWMGGRGGVDAFGCMPAHRLLGGQVGQALPGSVSKHSFRG